MRVFVDDWVTGWNAHDLESVLSHFADDVVFTSPVAAELVGGGVVRGKAALREYWSEGLRQSPDLRFEVMGVYVGVHTVVINCRNQRGGLVNEVLTFEGSLVAHGHGTYLSSDATARTPPRSGATAAADRPPADAQRASSRSVPASRFARPGSTRSTSTSSASVITPKARLSSGTSSARTIAPVSVCVISGGRSSIPRP